MNSPKRCMFPSSTAWIGFVAILLVVGVIILSGYYPLALVGPTPLFARDVLRREKATLKMYDLFSQARGATSTNPLYQEKEQIVRIVVVEQLINESLVRLELKRRLSDGVVEEMVRGMFGQINIQRIVEPLFH